MRHLLILLLASQLAGCASARVLGSNHPDTPLIYGGSRLDWYSLNGGCCPLEHYRVEAPEHPGLDLAGSLLLDTLLLPFTLASELGLGLGVRGGN